MLDPFALDGQHFLIFYSILLGVSWVFGKVAAARYRPDGREQRVTDPDSLALLNGGTQRLAQTGVARLLAADALRHIGGDRFGPGDRRGPVASTLDRGMLTLPMPARWRDLARVAALARPRLAQSLQQQGLYMETAAVTQMRLLQALPLAALLLVGVARLAQGIGHGKPVGFLVLLMLVALGLLLASLRVDHRTRAGIRAARLARIENDRIRRAPQRDEMGFAVALFGTSVLAGSALEPLHRLQTPSGDGGGDAGTDGGDGGGGCGGGCGGCGS